MWIKISLQTEHFSKDLRDVKKSLAFKLSFSYFTTTV